MGEDGEAACIIQLKKQRAESLAFSLRPMWTSQWVPQPADRAVHRLASQRSEGRVCKTPPKVLGATASVLCSNITVSPMARPRLHKGPATWPCDLAVCTAHTVAGGVWGHSSQLPVGVRSEGDHGKCPLL